jgi:hypothetical protein
MTPARSLVAVLLLRVFSFGADHYFEIVDEKAAREYWSIRPLPKGDRKVITIA